MPLRALSSPDPVRDLLLAALRAMAHMGHPDRPCRVAVYTCSGKVIDLAVPATLVLPAAEPVRAEPAPEAPRPDAELLSVLFSPDEVRILSELLRGATKATAIADAARVEKSKFWALWSNLQHRGIVVDAESGEGFAIGPEWLRDYLTRRENRAAG